MDATQRFASSLHPMKNIGTQALHFFISALVAVVTFWLAINQDNKFSRDPLYRGISTAPRSPDGNYCVVCGDRATTKWIVKTHSILSNSENTILYVCARHSEMALKDLEAIQHAFILTAIGYGIGTLAIFYSSIFLLMMILTSLGFKYQKIDANRRRLETSPSLCEQLDLIYKNAMKAEIKGDLQKAEVLYRTIIEQSPDSDHAKNAKISIDQISKYGPL